MTSTLWELAGLVRENGEMERPIEGAPIEVPHGIELEDWRLEWGHGPPLPVRSVIPGPGLLSEFIGLADAPAIRIRDYARRWGVLGICVHWLPADHSAPPVYSQTPLPDWPKSCTPLYGWLRPACLLYAKPRTYAVGFDRDDSEFPGLPWEPIGAWRHYARQARAVLNIAACLHSGRPVATEDVETIDEWHATVEHGLAGINPETGLIDLPSQFPKWEPNYSDMGALVARVIEDWLWAGNVRPIFRWESGAPRMLFGQFGSRGFEKHSGLFAALAMQLALAVGRTDGLAICSACSSAYVPLRRPRADRRNYCPSCGRTAALRDASTRWRLRRGKPGGSPDSNDSNVDSNRGGPEPQQ
jgi:hypothetical protein